MRKQTIIRKVAENGAELLIDYSFLIFIIFLHGLIEFHMFLQLKKK